MVTSDIGPAAESVSREALMTDWNLPAGVGLRIRHSYPLAE
jgi:hypothetical protein